MNCYNRLDFSKLVIPIFVLLAITMTREHSLNKLYDDMKDDMRELGYDVPEHHVEVVRFYKDIGRETLGANYTMGSYGLERNHALVILINPVRWKKLTRVQKKLLLAHEWLHSGSGRNIYHDFYDNQDIMNYRMDYVTEDNWMIWLEHTLRKNYLI